MIFNIKFVDNENKPIPNISYYLIYKGNEKKHTTGANGIEQGVSAESGKEITVSLSGKDSKQTISSFTVSSGKTEQIVKLDLHGFEILFQHGDTKSPISNLRLVQTYRGKVIEKQTDKFGKIAVKAMPGFNINYKLRDGSDLITIKVDKNKTLRVINVDSRQINNATKKIKDIDTSISSSSQAESQDVKGKDETSKRDQKTTTSQDGHPKIIVNDNGDVEFKVLTYDKISHQLASDCEYIIEYKGNKKSHISGVSGLGEKIHKGQSGQEIKIFENKNLLTQFILQKGMQPISINVSKQDLSQRRVSGVDWCSLYLQSSSLNDLVEPFKSNATKFINGMRNAGITVVINTTWRPDKRSYLMYYCTEIARSKIAVDKVPSFPGVNIDWTHKGNKSEALKAAKAMYKKYGIGSNPVGKPGSSNHNRKMAVDMKISNYAGKIVTIEGESTKITSWSILTQLGKKYNVIWYGSKDTPHWSHTGR